VEKLGMNRAALEIKKQKQDRVEGTPCVVVPIVKGEFDQFLSHHFNDVEWPFRLEILDSDYETDDLVKRLNDTDAEVMLTAWSTKPLPHNILEKVPSLKYTAHVCGAVCGIISRDLIAQGLLVTNWGDSVSRTVAEHCLLQVLACLRKATNWQIDMHIEKQWKPAGKNVMTLFGKSVGIYGFGSSAREFVKLIKAFDCKVAAFDPYVNDDMFVKYGIKRSSSLEELFSQNEIIVDLAALTADTKGSVTEELLNMLPDCGVFVNSARGPIVDEAALIKVARSGRIQIALDVYHVEPLPQDSPLRGSENVFLTPHIGGPTTDERKTCGLYALKNIKSYFEGKPLNAVIGLNEYDLMT
jgi:phosphoglycerate dehydrogenase-like enzyme